MNRHRGSQDNSVHIVTRLWPVWLRNDGFFYSLKHSDHLWGPLSQMSSGYCGLLYQGNTDLSTSSSSKVMNAWSHSAMCHTCGVFLCMGTMLPFIIRVVQNLVLTHWSVPDLVLPHHMHWLWHTDKTKCWIYIIYIYLYYIISCCNFYTDHDGSVSMPEEPEQQESDDTMTKTPTPPPATGSFSSLQFRSLQTTPIVGPRSQMINLSNYFPRVSSDPTSRKRYHTAPREKHRVRKQRFVNWSVFRHLELIQSYCGPVTQNFILSSQNNYVK